MTLIPIENAGEIGIVKDIAPWQLPTNAFSDGNNVRMTPQGAVEKCEGYSSVMATVPIAPYHIVNLQVGATNYWIVAGLAKIYVHNGSSWTDITRTSGDYSATAAENWTSTIIGGVLVLTNGVDDPQFWALSSGVPSTSTKMADLTNWPASTECKAMRGFKSFLIAMNVTKSSVPYTTLVKWSTEAGIHSPPASWSESDATVDAGEYTIQSKTPILDGLPLHDTFMIYTEDSVWAMQYVGTPFIFSFRQLTDEQGALSKNCVKAFSGGHFILANGDLLLNNGQTVQSILPHKLRDYLFNYIDGEQYKKSFVTADYARTEMLAVFPSADTTSNQCDKAIIWNWTNNTFSIRDVPDLADIGYGVVTDETALSTWAAATPTWSSVTGHWAQNWDAVENVLLFASPTDTKLYRDSVGNKEDTTTMTSYIERTGLALTEQNAPDQSTVKRIKAVWPKLEINNSNSINVYVGTQNSTEDPVSWKGPFEFNPDTQSKVSCRATGKFYGVKFESTTDMDWKLHGFEVEVENAGRRGSRSY